MFQGQQWTVVKFASTGIAFMAFVLYLYQAGSLPFIPTKNAPKSDGERLTYAFRCLAFSILPLFMGIRAVGNKRFSNIDTLGADPTAPVDPVKHRDFLTRQRNLQNTLEQTVLHIGAVLALASSLPLDQLSVIPVLVFFFVIGRITYYIGYLYFDNQLYRGFGFGVTFMPSVVGLGYALFIIIFRN
nr:transmembrane protein 79-like [Lytechinus pictus]